MALRESIEQQGEWLFKRRSYLPAIMLVILAIALWREPLGELAPHRGFQLGCLALGLLGLATRVLVAGFVPKRTSGRNTKKGLVADKLNTTGIYSVVRHPLYLGNLALTAACLAVVGIGWVVGFGVIGFWIFYERIALAEEGFLRNRFGQEYEDWASGVPAFFPRSSSWQPAALTFCWRTALKREYTTLTSFVLVFTGLIHLRQLQEAWPTLKRLRPDPIWSWVLASVLVFYLLVRVVRKARMLSVEGR
jgi:protein-S-isoprenylcysteine O-methyltransferase Ste14